MQLRRRCPRTTKCSALSTPSTLPTPVTDFLVSYTVILLSPSCPNIYQHISSYMVICHGIQTLRSLLTTRQISLLSARFLSAISLYTFNSHSWYPSVTHADIAPMTRRLCRWTQNVLLKNILYILNMYIGIYDFFAHITYMSLCEGRYQGDTYAGGNPWVLSTAALGSLLYRAAAHVLSKEEGGLPSEEARAEWKAALNSKDDLPSDPAALASIFIANVRTTRIPKSDIIGFHLLN